MVAWNWKVRVDARHSDAQRLDKSDARNVDYIGKPNTIDLIKTLNLADLLTAHIEHGDLPDLEVCVRHTSAPCAR